MKNILRESILLLLLTGGLVTANITFAQTVDAEKTTVREDGTISEFGPQSIIIKSESGIKPARYIFNESTSYVDEEDKAVAYTSVKFGLPVTVYYNKIGDTLFASKVVLRKKLNIATVQPGSTPLIASAGVIREFGPERIGIKTETSADLQRYTYTKTTTYVDEKSRPVTVNTIRTGLPVTVYYHEVGDSMVASKVIVKNGARAPGTVTEESESATPRETEK